MVGSSRWWGLIGVMQGHIGYIGVIYGSYRGIWGSDGGI
jgi:hypothetical protein